MPSPWNYRAYDLHWASDFELPELPLWSNTAPAPDWPALDAPDLTIALGQTLAADFPQRAAATAEGALEFGAGRSRLLFRVARFTVTDGNRIEVEPVEGYGPAAWRVPLLGSVLAVLLEQRGLFALHAGALEFPTGAAAFLGDKGQGKSTLNAALGRAGFPLLSDDVVALQMPRSLSANAPSANATSANATSANATSANATSANAPLALPGFSQIKLAPDALRAVTGDTVEDWPGVAPELESMGLDKRAFRAPLASQAQPLRALFVLHSSSDEGADGGIQLRRLSAQEALARLIPHTFGARFGEAYLRGERRKTHFLDCARLVNECAVWELSRPRDLGLLPVTVERIAQAMAELGA